MKYLILFFVLFTIGCNSQPNNQPVIENPSSEYINGYKDGYSGRWLAPVRWVLANEYRHGWNDGSFDKEHNLQKRYN